MKKTARIKKNIDERTTQPRTDCGRSYEHSWHLYGVKSGKKICDGSLTKRR